MTDTPTPADPAEKPTIIAHSGGSPPGIAAADDETADLAPIGGPPSGGPPMEAGVPHAEGPSTAEPPGSGFGEPSDPLPPPQPNPEQPQPRRSLLGPVLGAVAFVVLAAAILYAWLNPRLPPSNDDVVAGLRLQLASMQQHLAAVESRPPLEAPPAPPPQPPTDLKPLEDRVAALEKLDGQIAALQKLSSRVTVLENKPPPTMPAVPPPPPAASPADLKALADRVAALAASEQALNATQQAMTGQIANELGAATQHVQALADHLQADGTKQAARLDAIESRLTAVEGRLGAVEKAAAQLPGMSDRATKLARLQAAAVALQLGQKLGVLPDAPASLSRFADAPPPTEAALRQSFPAAAIAAAQASEPSAEQSIGERMWSRVESAITIRQGDHVIVGDPAAGILAQARAALDAGDLSSAVADVERLSGPPAAAMANWLGQAKSLLEARAALADLAARA